MAGGHDARYNLARSRVVMGVEAGGLVPRNIKLFLFFKFWVQMHNQLNHRHADELYFADRERGVGLAADQVERLRGVLDEFVFGVLHRKMES